MLEVLMLLQCLQMSFAHPTLRRLQVIVPAILAMSGRVTLLGISRWTGKGGSYCTIQRFFNTPILWCQIHWTCFCQWFLPRGKAADGDI